MDSRQIQAQLKAKQNNILIDEELEAQLAAEKNKDIKKIQANVEDIHSITTDFNLLLLAQGEELSQAEAHVNKAAENTKAGAALLEEANTAQDNRRKRTAWIIFILASIGAALGGGAIVRSALGIPGTLGLLAGAAIVLGGIALLAGICYGIVALVRCCRPKAAEEDHQQDEYQPRKKNSDYVALDLSSGFGASPAQPGFVFEARQKRNAEASATTNTSQVQASNRMT